MGTRTLVFALFAVLASACRSSSFQNPPLPPQELQVSRPELARIYVTRDAQLRGSIRSIRVLDGESEIGLMGSNEFLCWERPPGRTLLSFVYEGPAIDGGHFEGLFSLDAEAGRTYYLGVHLERKSDDPELRSRAGHPEVSLLSLEEGQAIIRQRSPVPVRDQRRS